jgi:hypothetical protein
MTLMRLLMLLLLSLDHMQRACMTRGLSDSLMMLCRTVRLSRSVRGSRICVILRCALLAAAMLIICRRTTLHLLRWRGVARSTSSRCRHAASVLWRGITLSTTRWLQARIVRMCRRIVRIAPAPSSGVVVLCGARPNCRCLRFMSIHPTSSCASRRGCRT